MSTTSRTSSSSPRSTSTTRRSARTSPRPSTPRENNTIKIADVPDARRRGAARPDPRRSRQVLPPDHRGVRRASRSTSSQVLKDTKADVLVSYLPVGSEEADKFYAQCAIDAKRRLRQRPARLHRLRPGVGQEVRGRRRPDRRRRHQVAGRRHHHAPRDGEAVRGPRRRAGPHLPAQRRRQHGLQEHARARAPGVQEGLRRPRPSPRTCTASSRTRSTTATCTSARRTTSQWLDDRKWAYVRLEGRAFGDVPLNLEYKLEVWDSPNSAGIIIDAIRAAKIAKDRGLGGPIISASSYLMKSPPVQLPDDEGRRRVEAFIAGEE